MSNTKDNNKLVLDTLYRHSFVFILAFVLILGSAAVLWNTHQKTKELNQRSAVIDAKDFASSVSQFRNFYSKTIVPAARSQGMKISHDYIEKDDSIPLPATFAKDFGQSLSLSNSAYTVKLFSDQPFPWRKDQKLDKFEKDSLAKIQQSPNQPVWSFETLDGVPVLRYARGDVLKENCIACHNSYIGTPKTDWKVGDVRGVLEVIRPISAFETESTSVLKNSFLTMLALILSMVLLIFFVLRKLSRSIKSTYDAYVKEEKLTKELKASDVKMHAIVDSVQEVIIVLDKDGVIQESNYAIQSMFGYDQQNIVGKNITLLLEDNVVENPQHLIRDIVGKRREVIGIHNNKEKLSIELFVNEAHLDSQTIYTASLRDISHFKKAEEVTAQAHKAALESAELKSEFLANMSHEIRTPMNGVIGMTELLLHSELDDDQKDLASTVKESADSLLTIINDILDFSKIEAGKLSIVKTPFDLLKMIEGSLSLLSNDADHKNVEMTFFIDSNVPMEITQDAGRLRQVLINLCNNALKFTENGNIILHISMKDNQTLHFSVIDTGIGIPKESQDNLFDSFSQVDGSNSREHGGTGLGLAICKQLINLMDGEIGVQSELHVGSTFWFTIKIDPIEEAIKPYIYGKNSVLMMSSSDLLNRYYNKQLTQWGMKSTVVKKLNDLTDKLDKNSYDMLCIDTDNIYLDEQNPESFLQVINTIQAKSEAIFFLYASRKQFKKIKEIESDQDLDFDLNNGIYLFEKPVKHTAIKSLLYQLSKQKRSQDQNFIKNKETKKNPNKPLLSNKNTSLKESSKTHTVDKSLRDTPFHILLAEDNLVNQKVAMVMLKKLGYQVSIAENGEEAYIKANDTFFDTILMDCQMPVMDGYEATKRIRALPPSHFNIDIPIIAFTAHAMKDDDNVCKEAGMDDYLSKPITLDSLNKVFEQRFDALQERQEKYLAKQK